MTACLACAASSLLVFALQVRRSRIHLGPTASTKARNRVPRPALRTPTPSPFPLRSVSPRQGRRRRLSPGSAPAVTPRLWFAPPHSWPSLNPNGDSVSRPRPLYSLRLPGNKRPEGRPPCRVSRLSSTRGAVPALLHQLPGRVRHIGASALHSRLLPSPPTSVAVRCSRAPPPIFAGARRCLGDSATKGGSAILPAPAAAPARPFSAAWGRSRPR